jgi:hypothetical protein
VIYVEHFELDLLPDEGWQAQCELINVDLHAVKLVLSLVSPASLPEKAGHMTLVFPIVTRQMARHALADLRG